MNHPKSMFQLSGVHYKGLVELGVSGLSREFRELGLVGFRVQAQECRELSGCGLGLGYFRA